MIDWTMEQVCESYYQVEGERKIQATLITSHGMNGPSLTCTNEQSTVVAILLHAYP